MKNQIRLKVIILMIACAGMVSFSLNASAGSIRCDNLLETAILIRRVARCAGVAVRRNACQRF